jgi:hypothetical protein
LVSTKKGITAVKPYAIPHSPLQQPPSAPQGAASAALDFIDIPASADTSFLWFWDPQEGQITSFRISRPM